MDTRLSSVLLAIVVAGFARHAAATGLDDAVLAEVNRARTDPVGFAATLRDFRRAVSSDGVYRGTDEPTFRLTEGTTAIDEAIAALAMLPPLPPLAADARLAAAARDQTASQGPTGGRGHDGPAGTFAARMAAHGVTAPRGEAIAYGHAAATAVVIQLIVDDGVPSRGHRSILLNPAYRVAGVACGPHVRFGTMCTIDFAAPEE